MIRGQAERSDREARRLDRMPASWLPTAMIRGIHGLLYSSDPDATRAFFRDQVKLPGSDIGEGWWIFDFREGDLGVHPIDHGGVPGGHDVSFYCDDIEGTVAAMKQRGVVFTKDIADHGYGLVTYFDAPGGITIQLYQPRYRKGASKPAPRAKTAKRTTGKGAKTPARKARKRTKGASPGKKSRRR
jgi:predicted enzyme related to lactoylglutathione lyase